MTRPFDFKKIDVDFYEPKLKKPKLPTVPGRWFTIADIAREHGLTPQNIRWHARKSGMPLMLAGMKQVFTAEQVAQLVRKMKRPRTE